MKKHHLWAALPFAVLGTSVLAHAIVIAVAARDPSFAVAPDRETLADRWDEHRAALDASVRLGWTVAVDAPRIDRDGVLHGRVSVRDADGAPVTGVTGTADAFHLARAADRHALTLSEVEPGVLAFTLRERRPGIWAYELALERGAERWIGERRAYATREAAP